MREWRSNRRIEVNEIDPATSDNRFDSGEEFEDESDLDYNPPRDR